MIAAKDALGQDPESVKAWCDFGEALKTLQILARGDYKREIKSSLQVAIEVIL